MPTLVVIARPGAPPEERHVPGEATAGGSQADTIALPGAAPGAVRLTACLAGVVVEAAAAGVRAAGTPLAPGARRLVRAGERVELHGASIAVAPPAPTADGTRAAAGAVLRYAVAVAAAPGPRLVVLTGRDAGALHALAATQVLGRGRTASVRIADPRASRRHARLELAPGGAVVVDLGAKNGLFVNGVRVERAARPLRDGDELRFGDTLVAFEDPRAPPGAADAPPAAGPSRVPARRGLRLGALEPRVAAAALLAASALALAVAAR